MGTTEAAHILVCPNLHMYVPTKPTAAKVRPLPATRTLVLSDVSQALNLGSLQRRCSSTVDTAVRRVSALLFQLRGPWASPVVAAPPLTVDHPPDSALEVAGVQKPIGQEGTKLTIGAGGVPRWEGAGVVTGTPKPISWGSE